MLRLLGLVFILVICVSTAPWGLLVGAILCIGWFLVIPALSSRLDGMSSADRQLRGADARNRFLSAIPLSNAVYCVNCDLITNSPHDSCGVCGSHSVIGVSRMWQLTLSEATPKAARFKVSFTAEVLEIPVTGLNESTKLISRLAELGGDVKVLQIQVDTVFSHDSSCKDENVEIIKPVPRAVNTQWQQLRRKAS
jgi:hypothetical protein